MEDKKVEWVEITGDSEIWHPEEKGESIEGIVKEIRQGQYGLQIILLSKDNKEHITPSHKVLQSRLSNVKVNEVIKIIFEGKELPKTKGQKETMLYKVLRAKQE